MTSFGNPKYFNCSTPNWHPSTTSNFGSPEQVESSTYGSPAGLQFHLSPLQAVFIVPPPFLLLRAPTLTRADVSPWLWNGGYSPSSHMFQGPHAEGVGHDFTQILKLSMRQIERRLAESLEGKENIMENPNEVAHREAPTPVKRVKRLTTEGPLVLRAEHGGNGCEVAFTNFNFPQANLKDELLGSEHLRKAKLMFLYTRYPKSAYLKSFFPEVTFNRNNTAQLIKWFSNFREFFYINIERYTRTLVAEGVLSPDVVRITPRHGVYRALTSHYNRGLTSETPLEFITVVEKAVQEFLTAIITGSDNQSAWKKKIYKRIARLDRPIPEHFRQYEGF